MFVLSACTLVCQQVCVVKRFETNWANIVERYLYSYKLCHCALVNLCIPKKTRGGSYPNGNIAWTGRKHKSNLFDWKRKERTSPSFLRLSFSRVSSPSFNSPTQQLFLSLSALLTPHPAPMHAPPTSPTGPSMMALFHCCAAYGRETPVWSGAGVWPLLNAWL